MLDKRFVSISLSNCEGPLKLTIRVTREIIQASSKSRDYRWYGGSPFYPGRLPTKNPGVAYGRAIYLEVPPAPLYR